MQGPWPVPVSGSPWAALRPEMGDSMVRCLPASWELATLRLMAWLCSLSPDSERSVFSALVSAGPARGKLFVGSSVPSLHQLCGVEALRPEMSQRTVRWSRSACQAHQLVRA